MSRPELRAEALRLRTDEGLSHAGIADRLNISKASASALLRSVPLSEDERSARKSAGGRATQAQSSRFAPIEAIPSLFTAPVSGQRLRDAAVGHALAWFMSRGYVPSVPVASVSYDLVVESDAGLKRVQVKSTTQKTQGGASIVGVHRHVYDAAAQVNAWGKGRKVPYTEAEVDVFFVMTGDAAVYLIPIAAAAGKISLTLDRRYAAFLQT